MGSSFLQSPTFYYNPSSMSETEAEFSGILEIHVHHARNIHNICIYDKQDVYAKFSLTYNPDEIISTRIVNCGGKNPEFNQDLIMKVNQVEAVLKCEIWMLSRAKNILEDQLLGFALVPLSTIINKGKLTQDFSLSSTDLFHSPAGTVRLSLFLSSNYQLHSSPHFLSSVVDNDRISSELDLLDKRVPEFDEHDPAEYSRIEFPDIECVNQNQKMVSEYFDNCSFLHLGGNHPPLVDHETSVNSLYVKNHYQILGSPNGSIQNSGLGSTLTSLTDDRNHQVTSMEDNSMESPTSLKMASGNDPKESAFLRKRDGLTNNEEGGGESVSLGEVFTAPLGKLDLDAEQSSMQQQIMDMYMKSMQQFSQSLENMKLQMDIDTGESVEDKDDNHSNSTESVRKNKNCSRVFYGSRAFF